MKKGQLMSQPFVYIFALIVGALILVYGISLVWDFVNTAKTVETGTFLKDLDGMVGKLYSFTSGSNQRFLVSLPSEITHLCITGMDDAGSCKEKTADDDFEYTSCRFADIDEDMEFFFGEGDNIFLAPMSAAELNTYSLEELRPRDGVTLCVRNGVEVKLTSKGTWVEAS